MLLFFIDLVITEGDILFFTCPSVHLFVGGVFGMGHIYTTAESGRHVVFLLSISFLSVCLWKEGFGSGNIYSTADVVVFNTNRSNDNWKHIVFDMSNCLSYI